eukprot:CAMPEP_0167758416 /NCGR_PEP_ID=MMETSP0110_2-20121227/10455_1 /TAXON_ID=629695 /ORGANISM="Gymnochlora sp., Strain CCMP2014" /LENGTH=379 /DNA_ID=CAMNT_0007644687 /DNA_START=74 /DNA_END=1213 /DNA_ORIENTATION=-
MGGRKALKRLFVPSRRFSVSLIDTNEVLGLKSCIVKNINASVLRMQGKDSKKFLQDFTSNDISRLDIEPALYTGWLNRKGRYLYDSIVLKGMEQDEFFLICESTTVPNLSRHIKIFNIRSEVKVTDISKEVNVWNYLSTDADALSKVVEMQGKTRGDNDSISLGVIDPRRSKGSDLDRRESLMGTIVICPIDTQPIVPESTPSVELDVLEAYRMWRGIPRDTVELIKEESLILEANFDWIDGVSFSKGCYLGQELTARSHHTGVIRKRLMPVRIIPEGESINEVKSFQRAQPTDHLFPEFFDGTMDIAVEENAAIKSTPLNGSGRAKSAGKLMSIVGNIGIAQVRLKESQQENVILKCDNLSLLPIVPTWWPSDEVWNV